MSETKPSEIPGVVAAIDASKPLADPVAAAAEIARGAEQNAQAAQAVSAAEQIATSAATQQNEQQTGQIHAAYEKMEDGEGESVMPAHLIEAIVGDEPAAGAAPLTTPEAAMAAAEGIGQQAHVMQQAEAIATTAAANVASEKPVVDRVPAATIEQPVVTPIAAPSVESAAPVQTATEVPEEIKPGLLDRIKGFFSRSKPKTEPESPEQQS